MVNKYIKNIFSVFILFFSTFTINAQSPEESVEKDYSRLYRDFKIPLGEQKAHYIIAIDVSSSMESMEASVKANLKNFIDALPNGDKITLIQMANKSETQVVNLTEYTDVDNTTRSDISKYIEGLKYKKKGDPGDGSDGFTMTDLIIKALNASGSSNDMKYVFIFSDLEFYDKNSHTGSKGYNKNAMPWKSLEGKLKKDEEEYTQVFGLVIKKPTKPEAVYKSELQRIFPNYNEVNCPDNSSILNKWFNVKKAEILNERLKKCLKNETERQNSALILKSSGLGKDMVLTLKDPKMSSVYSTAELDPLSLAEVQKISENRPWIGPLTPTPVTITVKAKLLAPKYVNSGHPNHTPSNPYNEVERLLQPQFAEYKIEVYECPGYLPWYVGWPLVAFLIFWLICILYTLFLQKVTRIWSISISSKDRNGNVLLNTVTKSFTNPTALTIGKSTSTKNHFNIDGVSFCINIESRKNIFCLPFPNKKSGYYIAKIAGGTAELSITNKKVALGNNKFIFLYKAGNFRPVTLSINETNQTFLINLK